MLAVFPRPPAGDVDHRLRPHAPDCPPATVSTCELCRGGTHLSNSRSERSDGRASHCRACCAPRQDVSADARTHSFSRMCRLTSAVSYRLPSASSTLPSRSGITPSTCLISSALIRCVRPLSPPSRAELTCRSSIPQTGAKLVSTLNAFHRLAYIRLSAERQVLFEQLRADEQPQPRDAKVARERDTTVTLQSFAAEAAA